MPAPRTVLNMRFIIVKYESSIVTNSSALCVRSSAGALSGFCHFLRAFGRCVDWHRARGTRLRFEDEKKDHRNPKQVSVGCPPSSHDAKRKSPRGAARLSGVPRVIEIAEVAVCSNYFYLNSYGRTNRNVLSDPNMLVGTNRDRIGCHHGAQKSL